jgi:LuxR family maltose regulon positive regulatory protein
MADEQTTPPLIRTKLHRPPMTKDHLRRERLLDRLEKNRQRPLTLVSAPAGYGKSTLLSCWLESCDVPSAWISLDNNDNDLRVFLAYLLAAVQTQFPAAGQKTGALLNSSKLPPLSVMAHSLINELDQIDRSFLLVLDDYHVISDQAAQGLIAELLQHPPGPLHLVLSSRVDPMLPLARFRARGQMTEIRARDLRFSREETKIFLDLLMGVPVDGNTAAVLEQKNEGWVTGLRLSGLFLRRRPDLNRVMENLPTEPRYVLDYLLSEVLSNQSEEIREYLLATAILDRFCATLCDAVCVPESRTLACKMGGQQFIEWLEKSDLFVIPLDEQGRWFRYHHLFQKLLQHQLKHRFDTDEIGALQRLASRWFAENNLIDEALQYALAAGDVSAAVELVEQNRHAPLNEDKWYVLEKWLAQLPDDIVQQRPALLMAKAWVLNFQFALWAIPPLLNAIKTLLGEESKEFPGAEMDLFHGIFLFWEGQGELATELLGRALEQIPAANMGVRNEAEIYFAGSSQIAGRGKRTVQTYRRKFYHETPEGTRKMRLLGSIIFIHLLSGELVEAEEATRQLKDMATRTPNIYIEAWSSYLQGIIHYHWNHLETAAHHFSRTLESRFALDVGSDIDSYAGLILSYQAMQQPDKAREAMARMMEFAQEAGNPAGLPLARSTRARLWLLQGDLESAVRWLETTDFSSDTGTLLFWLEVPRITRCRVLIAGGSEAGLGEATEKLRELLQFSQATHNTPQMIEILILQSMACLKQGQTDEALALLEQAITSARPGGYIRPFVNPGEPMADLLRRLLQQGKAVDYIGRILTAFDVNESAGGQVGPSPDSEQQPWVRNQALDRPLTNRELEILSYLGQGLRNKEIAAKLFVSPETVKKHASNICRKLNAHNRQQAVAQAHRLGILKQNL